MGVTITLDESEEVDIYVHTRAVTGASFNITEAATKKTIVEDMTVKHTIPDNVEIGTELPTTVHLTKESGRIKGPLTIKVKGQTMGGMLGSEDFMLVGNVYTVA